MKVGDLVKFRAHGNPNGGPLGLVLKTTDNDNRSLDIKWFCEYTPDGLWGSDLFEVVSEN